MMTFNEWWEEQHGRKLMVGGKRKAWLAWRAAIEAAAEHIELLQAKAARTGTRVRLPEVVKELRRRAKGEGDTQ